MRSARFGGDDPVAWLLGELAGAEERRAHYVSELVLVSPSGAVVRGTGTLEGHIADEPRGYEGFGFDPVFSRKAKNELLPSWETNGKPSIRTVPTLRAHCSLLYARPASSSTLRCSERRARHQLSSAPSTITFAIT